MDSELALKYVGIVDLDWVMVANYCCKYETLNQMVYGGFSGWINLRMLGWDGEFEGVVWWVGGTLWYVGKGDGCETNGRLVEGGIYEYWLIGFPPLLKCVALTFCVEVAMMEDLYVAH